MSLLHSSGDLLMNKITRCSLFCSLFLIVCPLTTNAGVREFKAFFNGFMKNPNAVGAFLPCMSRVGEELVRYMLLQQRRAPSVPLRILEVGAGTGSITEIIVKYLRPIDHLDLVELSSDYSELLVKKFGSFKNIGIYNASILDFMPDCRYDIIISTLPFMSLDLETIEAVLLHYKNLIVPGGFISFVGYAGIPEIKRTVLWGKRKREHTKKLNLLKELRAKYQIDKRMIFSNVPPINIYHLCITQ
jgi:phosphatidylethanolamine/phosphatidyl-N-methylethanolamine N-methyltransferase